MTTALSINVNKIALLRNSRGESTPDVNLFARTCLDLGADGITVHPRPDERHIRYADLPLLKELVTTYPGKEFNIEGFPNERFIAMVCDLKPHQVTLVPDPPGALTSSFGWDVVRNFEMLSQTISLFQKHGIRTSLFIDPDFSHFSELQDLHTDRVEMYTYDYAKDPEGTVSIYQKTASQLSDIGIGINAGHDLTYENVPLLVQKIPSLLEVSIGHAFVCDALYLGVEEAFLRYKKALANK